MTEAEINVVMGDGMADVEMEAIAIGMDEEGTPTGGTEDKEEKEKDLLWTKAHSHHYKGWNCIEERYYEFELGLCQ